MKFIKKIKKYFDNSKKEKKEYEETIKRQEELVKIIDNLKNIELFPSKEINSEKVVKPLEKKKTLDNQNFEEMFNKIIHINLKNGPSKKIDVIDMLDIEKMNFGQLQNTYKCVRKSIEIETKKNNQIEIQRLIQLKKKIKKMIISKNEEFGLDYIKCNLKFGNFDNLDIYEIYLNDLFRSTNSRKDKIEILSLIKLINKIRNQKNKQYMKKIG